jgi:hypothetical protein
MNSFNIAKAELVQGKARVAIVSPAGGGKTYTALVTAHELGKHILVIDTENGTSAKYAKLLGPFDVMTLPDYSIKTYIDALNFAATKGYDVVIVDSLSHAWAGKGGALEQAEVAKSKHGGNKFAGWSDVTPLQNQLVDTILAYPVHLIATMRMKTEYILTEEGGRQIVKKVGLGIVQRDSFEYEFDIIAQMDIDHNLTVTKTRCSDLDGFMMLKPDGALGRYIATWLTEGELPPVKTELPKPQTPTPQTSATPGDLPTDKGKFWNAVTKQVGSKAYTNMTALFEAIGGEPDFLNSNEVRAALNRAIDIANHEAQQATL